MQSKIFFGIIFILVFYAVFILYHAYLFNMLIAFLLCVGTFWIKVYLQQYCKNNIVVSIVTILLMITLLFIPLLFVLYRAFTGLRTLRLDTLRTYFDMGKAWINSKISHLPFVQDHLSSMLNEVSFSSISSYLLKITSTIGENGLKFFIDGFVIIVFLFVFFCWGQNFFNYIKRLLPFQEQQIYQVATEVSGTLRIVFLSTFFNVVLQGTAFGIIVYFFGFNGILLGIIYGICSMIPIIGAVIVWLPICLILWYQGESQHAIILALYSAIFIGFVIDNIVKPWLIGIVNRRVLEKPLQISEFVIFFAILAGIGAFGFWGIIIGPAITALFLAILRIYENDFLAQDSK